MVRGKEVKPNIKYKIVLNHNKQYPVAVMCRFFQMLRSGYYDFPGRRGHPNRDAKLAEIIAVKQENSFHTYGYRRMWLVLKQDGIVRNPKTILRIMKNYNLLSEIRRRRKWLFIGGKGR